MVYKCKIELRFFNKEACAKEALNNLKQDCEDISLEFDEKKEKYCVRALRKPKEAHSSNFPIPRPMEP